MQLYGDAAGIGKCCGRVADLHLNRLFGLEHPLENLLCLELPVGPGGRYASYRTHLLLPLI
jgi:hypothetical protein